MRPGLILFLWLMAGCSFATSLDSLETISRKGSPSEKMQAFLDLAWSLRHENQDSALLLVNKGLRLTEVLNDTSGRITGYIRKGLILREHEDLDASVLLLNDAYKLALLQNDSLAVCRVLVNLGQTHKLRGDYELAVKEILHAIVLLEIIDHNAFLNIAYSTLAGIYIQQDQFQRAIVYYEKVLEMALVNSDSHALNRARYNLGIAHFHQKDYETALAHFHTALKIAQQKNEWMTLAQLHNAIGSVKFEQRDFLQAIRHFQLARPLAKKMGFNSELTKVLNNLAAVHEALEEWPEAIQLYRAAALLGDSLGNRTDQYRVFLNLSETFRHMGLPDSALLYYQKHVLLKDSIFNAESNRQIVEMQEKYESATKDKSIALLNEVKSSQQAAIDRRNLWLAGVGLLAVLLLFVVLNYFNRLRTQQVLTKRTAELHQQKMMQLVNQNSTQTMAAYLEGETTERQRLASELHDQLGSKLATVKLYHDHLATQVNGENRESFLTSNTLLSEACEDVRKIAHNLAAETLTQFGLEPAIKDLCDTISNSGQINVQLTCIGMDDRFPPTIELAVIRSAQELMTNLIKHANASEVKVQLINLDEGLKIRISDNGIGIDQSLVQNAPGLGLKSIDKRISSLGGTFSIESSAGKGTTAFLEIPHQLQTNHNSNEKMARNSGG